MAPSQQSVLITGCTMGGAGHALALEFAAQSMRVFATARSIESLTGLEEKGIEILTLDVTNSESIAELRAEIEIHTGGEVSIVSCDRRCLLDLVVDCLRVSWNAEQAICWFDPGVERMSFEFEAMRDLLDRIVEELRYQREKGYNPQQETDTLP